jgi:hypothetical protein
VHGSPAEGFEDQEIEGALEEGQGVVGHSTLTVSSKGRMVRGNLVVNSGFSERSGHRGVHGEPKW